MAIDDFGRDLVVELGMPPSFAVWRVYASFGLPQQEAALFACGGYDTGVLVTGDFFDSGFGTERPPSTDQALALAELNWDSWVTIGNSLLDVTPPWPSGADSEDAVIVGPEPFPPFRGNQWPPSEPVFWAIPPTQADPGSGRFAITPQGCSSHYADGRVLLMQITIPEGAAIIGSIALTGTNGGVRFNGVSVDFTTCVGDTNTDGEVDVEDLVDVIRDWGERDAAGNVDGIGSVDVDDLLTVITAWGGCNS